eukprot:2982923-Alexandrium_andersonii.AAC.1
MSASLVGSEMCIRDRRRMAQQASLRLHDRRPPRGGRKGGGAPRAPVMACLLYTSDAADDM